MQMGEHEQYPAILCSFSFEEKCCIGRLYARDTVHSKLKLYRHPMDLDLDLPLAITIVSINLNSLKSARNVVRVEL